MIERKTICYSDDRVIEALKHCKNASRFFEEAAIYYLENIEEERINKECVKDIVINILKDMVSTGPISNQNYLDRREKLENDVMSILDI